MERAQAIEERNGCAYPEEDAKGKLRLKVAVPEEYKKNADKSSDERSRKHCQQRKSPADERADHRRHFNVSES